MFPPLFGQPKPPYAQIIYRLPGMWLESMSLLRYSVKKCSFQCNLVQPRRILVRNDSSLSFIQSPLIFIRFVRSPLHVARLIYWWHVRPRELQTWFGFWKNLVRCTEASFTKWCNFLLQWAFAKNKQTWPWPVWFSG